MISHTYKNLALKKKCATINLNMVFRKKILTLLFISYFYKFYEILTTHKIRPISQALLEGNSTILILVFNHFFSMTIIGIQDPPCGEDTASLLIGFPLKLSTKIECFSPAENKCSSPHCRKLTVIGNN
ncbi:Uncharacterised protein [Yersinia enterocolitica]|uniref:Uncharacterized protein n=5 Tax=Yersinia enterocolitica TaxID=630 RepID=A0A0H5H6N4_YEREN|nr:Uncharacterised protein [Yersinia enterocolitica]CFW61775.1 Uncharacterised protein [Yersinia enterocolitica]CNC07678.1 Uncharacterised protein [Yersinia enterocolitica]CND22279.1 Uncharacterised protein [Yersinia enterocolitica]CND58018.1 Uncharacterised protein [Yersinia enterocolitica]